MNEIILYVGLGIFIMGGIGFLIAAFRTGILWGLAVLLIAPVAILYLIVHWQDAKGPFKIQVFGLLVILLSAYLGGSMNISSSIKSGFSSSPVISNQQFTPPLSTGFSSSPAASNQQFRCDGRQHCGQMRSRAEAEFFLRNCPNTKMDGDNDGIPCENDSRF